MHAGHVRIAVAEGGTDRGRLVQLAEVVVTQLEIERRRRRPRDLNAILGLSRRARRVIQQNLALAAAVITVLVLVDLFGELPLPLGVLGHEGSTVLVGLNGLRLLSSRAWRE